MYVLPGTPVLRRNNYIVYSTGSITADTSVHVIALILNNQEDNILLMQHICCTI